MEESDLQPQYQQQQQQRQVNAGGLMRYQSAPSSFFSNLLDCEEFLNRPSSPETERNFARFLDKENQNLVQIKQEYPVRENQLTSSYFAMNTTHNNSNEAARFDHQQRDISASASLGFNQNLLRPPLPNQNSDSGFDYRSTQVKTGGNNSNLVRHSSSPAGLFSNINIEFENGYAVSRGMEDYMPPLSSSRMSPIAEVGNKNMGENSPDDAGYDESSGRNYVTGYPVGSWDDSSMLTRARVLTDDDRTLSAGLNAHETQDGDAGKPPRTLAHHMSLPKTAAEMSAIEKFLQLQDSVPCKIRAKRGCATHPRSIAERVRRTKISERMRRLQDLVPNMDKQTNTADMLDLAVDYIKDLQKQVEVLSENRTKCTCTSTVVE